MRILISNDDGIDAPGLAALERALAPLGEVWTVAPEKERSAQSHALTLHKPLRVKPRGTRRFAVSGTPADCVYIARHHLLADHAPDVVVSGVNRGANLGKDVHYSGTVAAAREAAMARLPAVAVSLHLTAPGEHHYDTAAQLVAEHLETLLASLTPGNLININVPDVPPEGVRGLKVAPLGHRIYADGVDHRVDPWGRDYYWIGGGHAHFLDDPETDGPLCEAGWATLTPLHADPSDLDAMEGLRERLGS